VEQNAISVPTGFCPLERRFVFLFVGAIDAEGTRTRRIERLAERLELGPFGLKEDAQLEVLRRDLAGAPGCLADVTSSRRFRRLRSKYSLA
jgi:hypothetical protein